MLRARRRTDRPPDGPERAMRHRRRHATNRGVSLRPRATIADAEGRPWADHGEDPADQEDRMRKTLVGIAVGAALVLGTSSGALAGEITGTGAHTQGPAHAR